MASRKAVDYKGLGYPVDKIKLGHKGIGGSKVLEPKPKYIQADNEHVISDTNGSYIVLGRDRPGNRISGYGHEHKSSRIDMVVGRASADNVPAVNKSGKLLYVDPNFRSDAARVYLSAKSDIDAYFNLTPGKVGKSVAKSSVGIKADAVRIIGTEGIKLVTRPHPINSQGGKVELIKGIDLIAGNDDRGLQPLVKGDNLVTAIQQLMDWVGKLNGIVDYMFLSQLKMNTALITHSHVGVTSAGMGVKTTPSISLATVGPGIQTGLVFNGSTALKIHRSKAEYMKAAFLKPWGTGYILSRYNNTN
jgi:hypothetical protein